jgi:hypothetical protein
MNETLPIQQMLEEKDAKFADLFKKVMNLHLDVSSHELTDKARRDRVFKAVKDSLVER